MGIYFYMSTKAPMFQYFVFTDIFIEIRWFSLIWESVIGFLNVFVKTYLFPYNNSVSEIFEWVQIISTYISNYYLRLWPRVGYGILEVFLCQFFC